MKLIRRRLHYCTEGKFSESSKDYPYCSAFTSIASCQTHNLHNYYYSWCWYGIMCSQFGKHR
jgi:hypothetical protein